MFHKGKTCVLFPSRVVSWKIVIDFLQEGGGEPPHGKLGWAIDEHFGSFEALVKKMNTEGAALQGSGWVVCTSCFVLYAILRCPNNILRRFVSGLTNHLLLVQWLALDKEAKKLSVETTANQVKDFIHVCLLFI